MAGAQLDGISNRLLHGFSRMLTVQFEDANELTHPASLWPTLSQFGQELLVGWGPGGPPAADAAQILQCFIGNLDHEEMWVLLLDSRNRIKNLVMLYKGSVNSSQVRVAEVFKQAILENAPAILLAHNHPSGNTQPSPEDVTVTRAIYQAGKLLDIDLLDHLVVARDTFVSLKEKGLGFA